MNEFLYTKLLPPNCRLPSTMSSQSMPSSKQRQETAVDVVQIYVLEVGEIQNVYLLQRIRITLVCFYGYSYLHFPAFLLSHGTQLTYHKEPSLEWPQLKLALLFSLTFILVSFNVIQVFYHSFLDSESFSLSYFSKIWFLFCYSDSFLL